MNLHPLIVHIYSQTQLEVEITTAEGGSVWIAQDIGACPIVFHI